METSWFVYLSIVEGLMICCMLGWEIFWLRKMYQVLWRMPTSQQLEEMVKMIKSDRESIKTSLVSLVAAFEPLKALLGGGVGGVLGSLFGSTAKKE
jgi:predicted transcriptional regulator with HTH domain